MAERLDVIIFGATGFTGKLVVIEAVEILKGRKWGVAGRSKEKLESIIKEAEKKTKTDLSTLPIIVADVKDEKSLQAMAEGCKVLVNCIGPYSLLGEPVVKACVTAGTHYVDVTAEPQFMESIALEYNKLAEDKGVYVISACGFDCITTDVGAVFIQKRFDGIVNSIEAYIEVPTELITGGSAINLTTWESAIHVLANVSELRKIRSKLFKEDLPELEPKLKRRTLGHKSALVGGSYCLPFPSGDDSVMRRTQRFFYENENKRPAQTRVYIAFRNYLYMVIIALAGCLYAFLSLFSFGRTLLLKYPRVFSCGFVSYDGPSDKLLKSCKVNVILYAEGWPKEQALAETTDKYTDAPSKKMIARVTANDPGYICTAVGVLVSALTILRQEDKLPGKGGVLTPGAAFANTDLIPEMGKYENGFKFEIISSRESLPKVETPIQDAVEAN